VKQGWGGENKLFSSFVRRCLENGRPIVLTVTVRNLMLVDQDHRLEILELHEQLA